MQTSIDIRNTNDWKRTLTVVLVFILIPLAIYHKSSKTKTSGTQIFADSSMDIIGPEDYESDTSPVPSPNIRTEFGSGLTTVRGFPSTGGIYLLNAGIVELDFLNLDRFHETPPSNNPAEEDIFCQRMRAVGARWFKSEHKAHEQLPITVKDGKRVGKMEVWLGWPEKGGVWVLEIEEFAGLRKGVGGRMRNAKTMEERCKVIEMLGGRFYGDKKECELTRDIDF